VVKDRQPVDFAAYCRSGRHGAGVDLIDADRIMGLFGQGASIVLQGLDETWASLNSVCRTIEGELKLEVHANAYVTPPRAQAMPIHTDDHDVIALQVHGSKRWLVYATTGLDAIECVTPLDVNLRRGDILYVPKHAPHVAATSSETSIHVALAILPPKGDPAGDLASKIAGTKSEDIEQAVRCGLLASGIG
jgi:lysine-specific demethylase/histidyl-hydroxylase NO66